MKYNIDARRREADLLARDRGGSRHPDAYLSTTNAISDAAFARAKAAANERIAKLSKAKS